MDMTRHGLILNRKVLVSNNQMQGREAGIAGMDGEKEIINKRLEIHFNLFQSLSSGDSIYSTREYLMKLIVVLARRAQNTQAPSSIQKTTRTRCKNREKVIPFQSTLSSIKTIHKSQLGFYWSVSRDSCPNCFS